MCKSRHAGRRASRVGIAAICFAVLLGLALAASPTWAACLPNANPAIRALQKLVDQDANAALKRVQLLLNAEAAAPHPNAQRLASLYSVQAQAFSILERESDARAAVFN